MKLKVLYFAALKEQAGKAEETFNCEQKLDGNGLYHQLKDIYGFDLPIATLRLAVNDQFVPIDHQLLDGDRVAFIPPVAGG